MPAGRPRTIVFDVSGHGFGHLGQVAPVVRELTARHGDARIVIRSIHPADRVREFLGFAVETDHPPPEAILAMRGPSVVDRNASAAAYRALHADWSQHVVRESARLAALRPAVLVADVPYLSLAAAARVHLPAIALCSLNWLDLYRTYCGARPEAPAIMAEIAQAYRSARLFLQPAPHMPMPDLPNRRPIGPLGRIGSKRGAAIKATLGLTASTRLVMATFGGIPLDRPIRLPDIAGVHWLAPASLASSHANASDIAALAMPFVDVMASCDAVMTKIGYATFVDAACNGVGIVSFPRPDWPESGPMIAWARENCRFALVAGQHDDPVAIEAAISAVLNRPPAAPVPPSGVGVAATLIARAAGLG
jgi:hypothetical protein